MDPRARTIAHGSSTFDDGPDSQAITVRTPNAPPLERPVVLTRDGRVIDELSPSVDGPRSPNSTLPMSARPVPSRLPLSVRAPASRQSEAQWFEKEPLVAPGVPEIPEPSRAVPLGATLEPRAHRVARAGGFTMIAVLLVGIAAAGTVFFLSSSTANEARAPEPTSTTQVTNAEVPAAAPVAPDPVVTAAPPAKPAMKTVRAIDLPTTPSYVPPPTPAPTATAVETSSESPDLQENR